MKNGLLSIGEFAKLRGINVKSLRYYESIGALKPAYVSPESGYRYYSINQLSDLDVVLTLIELGIPLKTIAQYTAGAEPEASKNSLELIEQGKKLAQQRIERAQAQLLQLEDYVTETAAQNAHGQCDAPYTRSIDEKLVLCAPLEGPFSMKSYATTTDSFYRFAPTLGLVPLFTQGILHDPANILALAPASSAGGGNPGTFVFMQARPLPNANFIASAWEGELSEAGISVATLPAGPFTCQKIKSNGFDECFDAGMKFIRESTTLTVLAEAWTATLGLTEFVLEVQEYQN